MRRFWLLAVSCVALVTATALSYRQAAGTASATLCQLPPDTERSQVRFGPHQVPGGGWRLAWILSYGPRQVPGHIGFQLVVSPTGRLITANPPDLLERVGAWQRAHGVHCDGAV